MIMTTEVTESYFKLSGNAKGDCLCDWKGNSVDIADLIFTAMNNDTKIAAVICQTAKDYIETCKGNLDKWKRLTAECADVSSMLAARYRRASSGKEGVSDGKEKE